MKKIIIIDSSFGKVSVLTLTDKVLEQYDYDVEEILRNEYEYYNPMIDWMDLELDEFGNFEVYQDTIYENKSKI